MSGIIFVVLALVWAGYLIPKALQHHDEVARTRSIDRFSTAMRVLAHREPVNRRDARLVVAPARAYDNPRVLLPTPAVTAAVTPAAATDRAVSGRPTSSRAAARAAARRRRRILAFLLVCDVFAGALAYLMVLPRWSLAIPVLLTLLYLVLCRTQARRERRLARAASAPSEEVVPLRRAVRVETSHETPAEAVTSSNVQPVGEVPATDETVTIPAVTVDAVADNGGSLWDPLPVTLPTYVTKPKATRTVRTIDLTEPGAWTSGHTEADSRLVQDASAEGSEVVPDAGQRAVGT
jgi:hypothetical protein